MEFDLSKIDVCDAPEMSVLFRPTIKRRAKPQVVAFDCANCGRRFGQPRCYWSAFCSPRCREQTKYVRYARARRREYGSEPPPDVEYALHIKRVHALSRAGYNDSARRISPQRRQEVWERDGGRCVLCGAPGEEMDHRNGVSNALADLRLLCQQCHHEVTDQQVTRIDELPRLIESARLSIRESSLEPLLRCDSPDWNETWRHWHRAHAIYAE